MYELKLTNKEKTKTITLVGNKKLYNMLFGFEFFQSGKRMYFLEIIDSKSKKEKTEKTDFKGLEKILNNILQNIVFEQAGEYKEIF